MVKRVLYYGVVIFLVICVIFLYNCNVRLHNDSKAAVQRYYDESTGIEISTGFDNDGLFNVHIYGVREDVQLLSDGKLSVLKKLSTKEEGYEESQVYREAGQIGSTRQTRAKGQIGSTEL